MRSFPLIRLAIVIALFLLALIPMWNLTAAKETAAPVKSAAIENDKFISTQIEVTSSPGALQFKILHLGKVVWAGTGEKATTTLPLPEKNFDLQVEATWAPDQRHENALRVRVSRDDLPLADSSFWGHEQIDDVLNVPAN